MTKKIQNKQELTDTIGVVVGYNESPTLKRCIDSISFCSEVLYVDLGSSDSSIQIAQDAGAGIIRHPLVPAVEYVHEKIIPELNPNWVLLSDPDEYVDPALEKYLFSHGELFSDPKIGAIYAPCRYYFKNHALIGTPWGGKNYRLLIAHKSRFSFTRLVHQGRNLQPGYEAAYLPFQPDICVHHYWMQSYGQLLKKHLRYLALEGEARYSKGEKTSWQSVITEFPKQFIRSFIIENGWKDGFYGLFLSVFWAWYQQQCLKELLIFQGKEIVPRSKMD